MDGEYHKNSEHPKPLLNLMLCQELAIFFLTTRKYSAGASEEDNEVRDCSPHLRGFVGGVTMILESHVAIAVVLAVIVGLVVKARNGRTRVELSPNGFKVEKSEKEVSQTE